MMHDRVMFLACLRRLWIAAALLVTVHGEALAQVAVPLPAGKTEFILAVSWQPGFCATARKRAECASQTADRFDATHFSLHGLWPLKKTYCGVAENLRDSDKKGDWMALPQPVLGKETADRLAVAMPGTRSGLDRHQWLHSGTCQNANAQDYFALQLRLLEQLNTSPVRTVFAERLGGEVTQAEVQQAFDEAFGAGAGQRVRMRCQKAGNRLVVTGLTIGLAGALSDAAALSPLILAAAPTDFKCAKGIVEAADDPSLVAR